MTEGMTEWKTVHAGLDGHRPSLATVLTSLSKDGYAVTHIVQRNTAGWAVVVGRRLPAWRRWFRLV